MARFFNTAGPNRSEWHYTLPVLERLPEVQRLIAQNGWFMLQAPPQSGKTSFAQALAHELTASGRFAALHVTCETDLPDGTDPMAASRSVIRNILAAAESLPTPLRPPASVPAPEQAASRGLGSFLTAWCVACPLPVVLLLDDIDALQGDAITSVLRQLRSIYHDHPQAAPSTVALIGMRHVRERRSGAGDSPHLSTTSFFNVLTDSLVLGAFTRAEVAMLYGQHTAETGQHFSEDALDRAWALTRGQPSLVNALANEVLERMRVTETIEAGHIDVAKERLMPARFTHLAGMTDLLDERRVRQVVEPMLSGDVLPFDVHLADLGFCVDLGLLTPGLKPIEIANPIYREALIRRLLVPAADAVGALPRSHWALPDGRLDLDGLLRAFVVFWKRNGEWMVTGQKWPESAHPLVLMAFLQRVVNGGGIIEREYGLGRGRVDLWVRWAVETDRWGAMLREDTHALELKVWRDSSRGDVLAEGLAQLDAFLDRLGAARRPAQPAEPTGTLVLFDARTTAPTGDAWEHRGVLGEATTPAGRTVRLLTA